eukprot:1112669-Amorphochlora_amoeboformis.AAC.1
MEEILKENPDLQNTLSQPRAEILLLDYNGLGILLSRGGLSGRLCFGWRWCWRHLLAFLRFGISVEVRAVEHFFVLDMV